MKVLVLTGKFGMGHWSAAQALKEQLEQSGHQAVLADFFDYAMPELSSAIYRGFSLLVTYGGKFYNLYHRMTANSQAVMAMDWMVHRFSLLLEESGAQLVVSTHPVCSSVVSRYKTLQDSALPLVTCITDVTSHSEWIHPATDCYLTAGESVRRGLEAKGVPADRIVVTGIPVSDRFHAVERSSQGGLELLIMGGGLGLMPRKDSFYEALDTLPGVHTTILTGRNEKLYRRLNGRYAHIEAVPFTDQVAYYMGRAHLMLSKPGGISSFEAIFARLPMLIWKPFLDQERENARFLVGHGLACVAGKEEGECLAAIRNTIYDDILLSGMARAMDDMANSLHRTAVCAVVQSLARKEVCA